MQRAKLLFERQGVEVLPASVGVGNQATNLIRPTTAKSAVTFF